MEELKSRYDDIDFHCRRDHEVMIYYMFETRSAATNMLTTLHTFAKSVLHAAYMLSTDDPRTRQSLIQLLSESDTYVRNNANVYVELDLADIADKFRTFFAEVRDKHISHDAISHS